MKYKIEKERKQERILCKSLTRVENEMRFTKTVMESEEK